jgi:hypothetical protein
MSKFAGTMFERRNWKRVYQVAGLMREKISNCEIEAYSCGSDGRGLPNDRRGCARPSITVAFSEGI